MLELVIGHVPSKLMEHVVVRVDGRIPDGFLISARESNRGKRNGAVQAYVKKDELGEIVWHEGAVTIRLAHKVPKRVMAAYRELRRGIRFGPETRALWKES